MSVLDKLRLDGKITLVTGAGRGLGRAMALDLAEAGADVVVTSRTQAQIDETADLIKAQGRRSLAVTVDITDSTTVNTLIEAARTEFGQVDILVFRETRQRIDVCRGNRGIFDLLLPGRSGVAGRYVDFFNRS